MERPQLNHLLAINTSKLINVRASLTYGLDSDKPPTVSELTGLPAASAPAKAIKMLFSKKVFQIKLLGLNQKDEIVFNRIYESDSFGGLDFKIDQNVNEIEKILIFEISSHPGIEHYVGSYIPIKMEASSKIVISDFDKTLVDTRYSNAKEVYQSLNNPLSYFPSIEKSIEIFKDYISRGFYPFIVTASPHFYEHAIRDWLYQNSIYTSGIFLKDYRSFFSFFDGVLTPKDIKTQGFYKLNHIISILLMTGIPKELALIGDGFESDPIIYLTVKKIMLNNSPPWNLWNSLREESVFNLTNRQNSHFLNKIYKLHGLLKNAPPCDVKIHIRHPLGHLTTHYPDFLKGSQEVIQVYQA